MFANPACVLRHINVAPHFAGRDDTNAEKGMDTDMAESNAEREPFGIIVIDKHEGVTSYRIIQILRRMFGTKKVGHTGTLDPMATGVLPVLLGRAVKAADFLLSEDKGYTAELKLGIETDTEDTTGKILREQHNIPDEAAVRTAVNSFLGEYDQIPPMYSAIKVGGRKLVDIAREGGEAERSARRVIIRSIGCERLSEDTYRLEVECSKGTYIRTLCADIGKKLGCGGAMAGLRRTRAGAFGLSCAHTIEELDSMSDEERRALVLPAETLFPDFPRVELGEFYSKLARSGTEIYLKKIRKSFPEGTYVRICRGSEFFAIGRVDNFPDGPAIKPVKQLLL